MVIDGVQAPEQNPAYRPSARTYPTGRSALVSVLVFVLTVMGMLMLVMRGLVMVVCALVGLALSAMDMMVVRFLVLTVFHVVLVMLVMNVRVVLVAAFHLLTHFFACLFTGHRGLLSLVVFNRAASGNVGTRPFSRVGESGPPAGSRFQHRVVAHPARHAAGAAR